MVLFAEIQKLFDTKIKDTNIANIWETMRHFCRDEYKERSTEQINAKTLWLDFGGN